MSKILHESNINLIGVDISEEMLSIAREKLMYYLLNNNLKLINHDFSENTLGYKFNKIYINYYIINYILNNVDTFSANIFDSLEQGGKHHYTCFGIWMKIMLY